MSDPKTVQADPSRRDFLRRAWLFLGGLVSLQVLWIGFDLLRPRQRAARNSGTDPIFVAGPVDRFAPGTVTAFPAGRFYLSRLEDGGFLALSRVCTHLGCTVPWVATDGQFACPCHASVFDITGQVLSAPAERALDHFPVRIENAVVKVDLTRPMRRRNFDPVQVARP